jgi:S1-C subfamily serine protease
VTTETYLPMPVRRPSDPVSHPHGTRRRSVAVGLAIAAVAGGTIGSALDRAAESGATVAPAASAPTTAAAFGRADRERQHDRRRRRHPVDRLRRGVDADAGRTQGRGVGLAVVLDADGHLATNRHVVETGTSFRVILSDGRT